MEVPKFEKPKEKPASDLTRLTQIREVSEEHSLSKKYPRRQTEPIVVESGALEPVSRGRVVLRYLTNCIKHCIGSKKNHQFTINEQEMTKEVERIKKKKPKVEMLLPPSCTPRLKTLVLDLDETLIYTSFKKGKHYDFSTEVEVNGKLEKIYVTKRFGLDIFLFEMSQLYELVIYTAGTQYYTDAILKTIDLQKRISHVLYREHCTILNGSYFLKNLGQLGRNLKQTILVDDNSMAGILHPQLFCKIQPFYGSSHDRKLLRLIDFLKEMAKEEDFTCLHQRRKDFSSRKVNIVSQVKKEALREDSYTSSGISLSAVISIED